MTTATIDTERVEAFGGQLVGILDNTMTALQLSVGHRTGLLDTLSGLGPSTSAEIATAAGLQERYVREWLGGLVVARIVTYDADGATYSLPAEHAALLTRDAGADNFAFFMQYVGMLADVEDDLLKVFQEGGGIPYSRYQTFQALQREETARVYDAVLVDAILPLAPGLVERLEEGVTLLDVGCGGGHAINVMARAFPKSTLTGVDISEEGIETGRAEAEEWGLTNVEFRIEDATTMTGRFDVVTAFDTVHDQAQPAKLLRVIAEVLADDGVFLMGDIAASSNLEENIGQPLAATIYGFSLFHCMTVSLAQGGAGLGTAWGTQKALDMLAEAGFTDVNTAQVEGDPLNIYYVARKH